MAWSYDDLRVTHILASWNIKKRLQSNSSLYFTLLCRNWRIYSVFETGEVGHIEMRANRKARGQ